MPDVVVCGPASWNELVTLDALPEPRPHTVFARSAHETLGGTSAGKALHLAQRGRSVRLHTVVGDDDVAPRILGALQASGVDVAARRVAGPSERHLNLMTERGERVSIYLATPAEPGEPPLGLGGLAGLADARAVVLDLAPWTRELALADGAGAGLPIWTDLHDYDGSAPFHEPYLAAARRVFLSNDAMPEPLPFMHATVDRGAELVVCTLGADGALAVDADHHELRVAAPHVERVVDTNGAGDAFFAGFLDATLDGATVEQALRTAADQSGRALGSRHLSPLLD